MQPKQRHALAETEAKGDTLKDETSPSPDVPTLQPYLFLLLECDRPAAGGARYGLSGVDEVVIGRGDKRSATRLTGGGLCRLVLRVPGRSMSSTHARLSRTDEAWAVEDTHSTNGLFVNGHRAERAIIEDGDLVEAGHSIFTVRFAVPTPRDAPADLDPDIEAAKSPELTTLLPSLASHFEELADSAQSDIAVLLLGETGTGKEVVARALHRLSQREGPFVAVNCGAMPANLVESHLFGHTKGAFSGALRDEVGFLRAANRGTLLLDEVGDLPMAAQPALLRVLQEREVVPVGSVRPFPIDIRVIAATNRPLDDLIALGQFREDLLARLDGYRFVLPSLGDRREDLGVLIARILDSARTAGFTSDAGLAIATHDWPLNVRELSQRLKRARVVAKGKPMTRAHLGLALQPQSLRTRSAPPAYGRPLSREEAMLKRELLVKLQHHAGNVSEVAREMGKARMQVQRWLKRFAIDATTFRE
jgi:DNA-binding NtrC family response regulator